MSLTTLGLSATMADYVRTNTLRESEALRALRERTAELENANWSMSPEQGQFMALTAQIAGVKSYLELGCFTGYGALSVASALPSDGRVITCERSEEYAAIAREYWTRAGFADRIEVRMEDALRVLDKLLDEHGEGVMDMVFIDADKKPYPDYYQRAVRLVRPGGLIAVDNAFRGGGVADPADTSKATQAIRDVTITIRDDDRVDMALVPIADGIILARKR